MNENLKDKILELKGTLIELKSCAEEFLELIGLEKSLLFKRDFKKYQELVERKDQLSSQIAIYEEKRQKIMWDISVLTRIPYYELNSKRLLSIVDESERVDLELTVRTLKSLMAAIKEANEQLSILVGKVLYVITGLFERLKQALRQQEYYNPRGAIHVLETPGLLISQKV